MEVQFHHKRRGICTEVNEVGCHNTQQLAACYQVVTPLGRLKNWRQQGPAAVAKAPLKKHWCQWRNIPKSFPDEILLDVLESDTDFQFNNTRKINRRHTLKIEKQNNSQDKWPANCSTQHMNS